MGKKKITIKKIENNRQRQLTFYKRRNGLIKKAMELSLLCNSDVLLCIVENKKTMVFSSSNNPESLINEKIIPNLKKNSFITTSNYSKFSKDLDKEDVFPIDLNLSVNVKNESSDTIVIKDVKKIDTKKLFKSEKKSKKKPNDKFENIDNINIGNTSSFSKINFNDLRLNEECSEKVNF